MMGVLAIQLFLGVIVTLVYYKGEFRRRLWSKDIDHEFKEEMYEKASETFT